ncbi:hypothetical protein R5R35_001535 [Gryllus longicercus]|uniref:Uncharacterized protein n=1 Tax=Gryllus longicercus TaxID=2509291 RepID=A0AAN9ZJB8_9ORTH
MSRPQEVADVIAIAQRKPNTLRTPPSTIFLENWFENEALLNRPTASGRGAEAAGVPVCAGTAHAEGCAGALQRWLRQSSDVLLVLGYCVLTFLKLCFAGILRCELREMIVKIRLLRGDARPAMPLLFASGPAAGGGNGGGGAGGANGGGVGGGGGCGGGAAAGGGGGAGGVGGGGGPPAGPGPPAGQPPPIGGAAAASAVALCDASVPLLQHNGCVAPRPLLLVQADAAEDSDTNSNSALLLADDAGGGVGGLGGSKSTGGPTGRGGTPSNGNNNTFELREFNRMLARHGGRL